MKQVKLIIISLIMWSISPMLQSCDKNDDDNDRQQDTTFNDGSIKCPDSNHPHMIDLGLPSGTKWACCNVGASAPEKYGNQYAWGEVQPKSMYDWDTYRWGSVQDKLTKYNTRSDHGTLDGIITLDASDDAATVNWGAPWRMPSVTEIEELLNKTTSNWTIENGVCGLKISGSNGCSIFLPAAGGHWYSDLYYSGLRGYYWSSTLFLDGPYDAYYLYFNYSDVYWYNSNRLSGQSVRPVR
jgi:hypothetical protein